MTPHIATATPEAIEIEAVALFLFEETGTGTEGHPAHEWTDGLLAELRESKEFRGKAFETALIHRPAKMKARRLLLVGAGKQAEFSSARLRRVAGTALRTAKSKGIKGLAVVPAGDLAPEVQVRVMAEGLVLADYEADAYKTEDRPSEKKVEDVVILADAKYQVEAREGGMVAEGQNLARQLVNEPGNVLTPGVLVEKGVRMADEAGLEVEILREDRLREMGMGALLGVAQGSAEPPYLLTVSYRPSHGGGGASHLGLVGKAVTFDTGGISIKPSQDMHKMKYDMAGGAAMLGAMKAIAELKPRVPVTAVVPAVENMPGSKAQRPGDVVKTLSGKTVEILNTDAEGRLILADALTYAQRLGCTHLVDAATLTGAIVVALGHVRAGVFSNSDKWEEQVLVAAEKAGEKMWPMPLDEEYKDQLKSEIADIPNIGSRWGGAVTAAMFLKQFADPAAWAHLDIAGTAWIEDSVPDLAEGPSGMGVRTFVQLAMGMS